MPNPPDFVAVRRALLSVSDKTDIVPFARALAKRGVELVSTGGTARALEAAGLPVRAIDDLTGFPEMMDGRLKTLHPRVHGGLLARRELESHRNAAEEHGIDPIDLVCVNLYPFAETLASGAPPAEVIEQIDIGGPAMVRSAAKNHMWTAIVTSPCQYAAIQDELNQNDGQLSRHTRASLAAEAFRTTATYDAAISTWMLEHTDAETTGTVAPPVQLGLSTGHALRYGENPHQAAWAYPARSGDGVLQAKQLSGKELSYNNLADAAAALDLVADLGRNASVAAAIIKHTNPCGAAAGENPLAVLDHAWAGDPVAAFGGILALWSDVDLQLAEHIAQPGRFLEVILAPRFSPDATSRLSERWPNARLLEFGELDPNQAGTVLKTIRGGALVQEQDNLTTDATTWQHVAGPAPEATTLLAATHLWTVVKHLSSNAVAVGDDRGLLGAGAGQMDRLTSCRIAIEKAGARLAESTGAVATSDAFFPFSDGPETLIDAGVKTIVQPGGSKRDQESIDLCNERNVTMLFTGRRHFRH